MISTCPGVNENDSMYFKGLPEVPSVPTTLRRPPVRTFNKVSQSLNES